MAQQQCRTQVRVKCVLVYNSTTTDKCEFSLKQYGIIPHHICHRYRYTPLKGALIRLGLTALVYKSRVSDAHSAEKQGHRSSLLRPSSTTADHNSHTRAMTINILQAASVHNSTTIMYKCPALGEVPFTAHSYVLLCTEHKYLRTIPRLLNVWNAVGHKHHTRVLSSPRPFRSTLQ